MDVSSRSAYTQHVYLTQMETCLRMQRSSRVRRHQVLIVALVAIFLIAGGMFALASGSPSPDPSDPFAAPPSDTDPETIGSGGQPATSTASPTHPAGAIATRDPTRTPTRAHPYATRSITATATPADIQGSTLTIASIGVSARVETKSTDANNVMQTPDDPRNVAWYSFTSVPGTLGNAVFAGHVDHASIGPAVFWDLWRLKAGDEISFTALDGQTFRYRITRTVTADSNDPANEFVGPSLAEIITLITCIGNFNPATQSYDQRLIVQGARIP